MMASLFALLQKHPMRWLLAIGWSVWIVFWLVQPEESLTRLGVPSGARMPNRELVSNGFHLIAFSIACFFWFWAWVGHLEPGISLALAVVIAISLGLLTEYQQTFSPDREASWNDLAANCVGVLMAAGFIWRRFISKAKSRF